jgi:hypothetical protein
MHTALFWKYHHSASSNVHSTSVTYHIHLAWSTCTAVYCTDTHSTVWYTQLQRILLWCTLHSWEIKNITMMQWLYTRQKHSWVMKYKSMSLYIGDPDVIDHCGLVWGGLRPEPSLGLRADNVIIPLDLIQLFCPGFMLAAGPHSGFTTDIVGCWGGGSPVESLQSHCIHTMSNWSSGLPVCFLSWGARVLSPGGYICETGILLLGCLATVL